MPESPFQAVFLSYAREDSGAACRIADALRSHGVEVWLDQNELRGGDAWDQKIRRQIRECVLFLPLISAHARSRSEGYFRLEWKLAVERMQRMRDGVTFVVPIALDGSPEDDPAVPEAFTRLHWQRMPGALPTPEFVAQINRLLVPTPVAEKPAVPRRIGEGEAAVANQGESVAVLPFTNISGDPENEYFSDGITEELLNVLANLPGLRVAARTSAFFFKGKNLPIREIARALGVDHVVEGSVRKAGIRVRITAQLINAETGFHLWSETFDRELRDIFELQDEIARAIAQKLQITFGRRTRLAKTVNPEAHRLVLEGRHFWSMRTDAGFTRAEAAFTKAIRLDPDFAEAHAGLANLYVIREQYRQLDGWPASDDSTRARVEAQRAIELDPSLADPHVALAFSFFHVGRLSDAARHFEKADTMSPGSPHMNMWYAHFLSAMGRLDASLARFQKVSEIDPLWFINLHLYTWELVFARQFEDAWRMSERAAALRSDVVVVHLGERARILLALGRTEEAVEAARLIRQRLDVDPRWHVDSIAVWVLQQAGLQQEAADYAAALFEKWPGDTYRRGFVLGALGRFDEALPYLDHTPIILNRSFFWEDIWAPWRDDPRFHQLLATLGCTEEYKVARATLTRLTQKPARPEGTTF